MGLNEERKKELLKRLIQKSETKRKFPAKKEKNYENKKKQTIS